MTIKNKEEKICIMIRGGNTSGQGKSRKKEAEKEAKLQEFMSRDTTNVKHEMYDYKSKHWCHQNSNKRFT